MRAPRERPAGAWTNCRPDWLSFVALAALGLAFFLSARLPPDYSPAQETRPSAAAESGAGEVYVQDFAYILNYARRAAGRPGVSPYSVEEHRRFLRAWLGPRVGSALCFAYTPTAVLLLSPLFALPTRWAWLVWNLWGAWVAAWAVRRVAGADRTLLTLGRVGLLSPNALYAVSLGQTALLTTGVLAAMLLARARTTRTASAVGVGLFVLTMKPPLAAVAAAALLAAGWWEPLVGASLAGALVLGAAIAWWGSGIVGDYLALVGHYNLVQADPLIRAGFVPGLMSNLRNVLLHAGLDDARASGVSSLVFAATLALPVLVTKVRGGRLDLGPALTWTAIGYALFSPHLSPTEDLILLVVLLGGWRAMPARLRLPCAGLCLLPQFAGGSAAIVLGGVEGSAAALLPLVAFAIKVPLAAVVMTGVVRGIGRS